MRAIIINAEERTVSEADIDGSWQSLRTIVGGPIDVVYPGLEGTRHHAYVNDEGLLDDPEHFFMLRGGHQPLAGNGVILSSTGDGKEAPCTLPLDWVKERVTFMDLQAARQWVAREPDQGELLAPFIGEGDAREQNTRKTYTACFYADGVYASTVIDADTPEEALAAARELDGRELHYERYSEPGPVNLIEILDDDCNALVEWRSEDERLRGAAPAMRDALEFVRMTFADMEASKRKGYYTECPDVVAAALAKATGPDPAEPELVREASDERYPGLEQDTGNDQERKR